MDIPSFFASRSVLVTGGTGFMGKVLVEKILRSCPDVKQLFLLIREKKGVSPQSRLEDLLLNSRVMDRIREECPSSLNKLVGIEGDVTLPSLGLSPGDLAKTLSEVSIVFHLAATVKFNQPLRVATTVNLEGTKNVAEIAKKMTGLQAFVQVSTAFCNGNLTDVEERVYPTSTSPEDYLNMIKSLTDEEIERLTPNLIEGHQYTYTYTKLLAENYLAQHCPHLPWTIVRPGAVLCSWKEPFPGWVENTFGPIGIGVGLGSGFIKALHANETCGLQFTPVDLGVNHMIAAAWDRATCSSCTSRVYNGSNNFFKNINFKNFYSLIYMSVQNYPSDCCLPSSTMTTSRVWYKFLLFSQHYLPAAALDLYLVTIGKKPRAIKAYNKVLSDVEIYSCFMTKQWLFQTIGLVDLQARLSATDKKMFNLLNEDLVMPRYVTNMGNGIRSYLFSEVDQSIQKFDKVCELQRTLLKSWRVVRVCALAFLIAATLVFFWYRGSIVLS